MVKKKSASIAEQLAELSNPAPCIDPEADVHSDTEAKLVDFDDDSSDEAGGGLQQPSQLRKLTSLPLSEGDKRYAGKTSSRNQWLADSDSDAEEESENQSADEDENEDEDEDGEEEEESDKEIDDEEEVGGKEEDGDQDGEGGQDDSLMEHFKRIAAQMEDESEELSEEEVYSKTETGTRKVKQKTSQEDNDESEEMESEEEKEEEDDEEDDEEEAENEDDDSFSEEDASVKPFSQGNLQGELLQGKATKAQLGLWDNLLEARIKLQKAVTSTNQMPQHDAIEDFVEHGGEELEEALTKGKDDLQKLVSAMIELQETLLMKNPETRHVVDGSVQDAKGQSDEEIPSDDEEIPSEDEEISSDDEIAIKRTKQNEKEQQNGFHGKKRKIDEAEFGEHLAKRHKDFEKYRNGAIQKWHDRTKLSSGKISSKSFSSFDKSPLAQIQQVLQDRARLIKRTQLKRTTYKILGKMEAEDEDKDNEEEEKEDTKSGHNTHLKDYDTEIFDDDDFYHQLLRELIEKKTTDTSDPVQLTRQWLEVQKLRSKVKKRVDTKASKGRKLRYDIHQKLVSFMAPIDAYNITDDARNELYGSLFGQRKFSQIEVADR